MIGSETIKDDQTPSSARTRLNALEAVVPDLHGLLPGELGVPELGEEGGEEVQLEVHLAPLSLSLRLLLSFAPSLTQEILSASW